MSSGTRSSQAATPPGPLSKPPMPSAATGRTRRSTLSACHNAISSIGGASSRRHGPLPRIPETVIRASG